MRSGVNVQTRMTTLPSNSVEPVLDSFSEEAASFREIDERRNSRPSVHATRSSGEAARNLFAVERITD